MRKCDLREKLDMSIKAAPKVALLWHGDREARDTVTLRENRLRGVAEALRQIGVEAEPAVYADEFAGEVRNQLLKVDGVLVWVNPIENGCDRSTLDAMLRQVADEGILVSAHPEMIQKMGTKEVLFRTRSMNWGCDTHLYATAEELRAHLPLRLAEGRGDRSAVRGRPPGRILKQHRGNGGNGVWKVELPSSGAGAGSDQAPESETHVRVRHALRGSIEEAVPLSEFLHRCEPYFTGTGRIIDPAYQERLTGRVSSEPVSGEPGQPAALAHRPLPTAHCPPEFGRAAEVVNVIDVRQSYAQQIVYHSLAQLGYTEQAERSHHLSYEVVSLSSAAARELGVVVEEGGRDVHAMSGRQGIGVKADDLIDLMVRRLAEKSPEPGVAERLAAAAIRYYMLRFTLNSMIVFDFDAATQATGDSGIYLVYSYVRANNILEKAGGEPQGPVQPPGEPTPAEKALAMQLDAYGDTLSRAADALAPASLATYAFELAKAFTDFYEQPVQELIIHTSDPALKQYRIGLVAAFRQVMGNTMAALGIPTVERV
jgi:hypothetical protein